MVLKKIFKHCLKFYLKLILLSRPWIRLGPLVQTTRTVPFNQGYFVPSLSLVKIVQVGQNVKRLQNERQMDAGTTSDNELNLSYLIDTSQKV